MEMIPVDSQAITHIGHDGKDLHVTYRGGGEYVHPGVSVAKFEQLKNAPSKGKFIAQNIRKQHPGRAK
jgi:hypothetical protein